MNTPPATPATDRPGRPRLGAQPTTTTLTPAELLARITSHATQPGQPTTAAFGSSI